MKENNNYCVYRHKSFDDRVYIGITCQNINRRWRNGNGYMHNPYFSRFIVLSYGSPYFNHVCLYEKSAI